MLTKLCTALLFTLAFGSLVAAEETGIPSPSEAHVCKPVHGLLTREDKALFSAHVEKPLILSDKMRSILNSDREGELRTRPSVSEAGGNVITSLKNFASAVWTTKWNPLITRIVIVVGVLFVSSLLKK